MRSNSRRYDQPVPQDELPHDPLPDADATRSFPAEVPVDVGLTLRPLQRGAADPCVRVTGRRAWLTRRTRSGAAALLVEGPASPFLPGSVRARAWGPGAQEAVEQVPAPLGPGGQGWSAFDELLAEHRRRLPASVLEARRRHPGLRLPAAGALSVGLLTVVLEQKVTHDQARHGWRSLVREAARGSSGGGTPPGPVPAGMLLPPRPEQVALIPSWRWHTGWVQPAQSRTLVQTARRSASIERVAAACPPWDPSAAEGLNRRLCSLPGIGPWSTAEALQRSHGAADLVSVGDYHLAHFVGQVLTGRRVDDAGMLELLAPFAGHRQRLVRLLGLTGERRRSFGPRLAPADHRRR